jgi:uncharacterized protein DUF6588
MKRLILIFSLFCIGVISGKAQEQGERASETTITITRMFAKDLFEGNGVPYLQPLVNAINATSNTGFYNTAFIPKQDSFYLKFSVHGMMGVVPDKYKTYKPNIPSEPMDLGRLGDYGKLDLVNGTYDITDTAGLVYYAFQTVIYDGISQGRLSGIPDYAATILGESIPGEGEIKLDPDELIALVRENPIYAFLPEESRKELEEIIKEMPAKFTLPPGANITTMFAAVPQIEIGSFMGTELLLRYIPRVYMGENIGNFSFWAFGLKHSISQYIPDPYLDIAIQGVYQGTALDNKVGVTEAQLNADGTIFHFNLQFSKEFEGIIDVYGGFAFETISIDSKYEYYLPIEVQGQLNMVRTVYHDDGTREYMIDPPDFPGDTELQYSTVTVNDNSFKGTLGVAKSFGGLRIFMDYNIRDYHIFQGGLQYTF